MEAFSSSLSEGHETSMILSCIDAKRGDSIRVNCIFWFEFELRQYKSVSVDVKGLIKAKGKLIPVVGADSGDKGRQSKIGAEAL